MGTRATSGLEGMQRAKCRSSACEKPPHRDSVPQEETVLPLTVQWKKRQMGTALPFACKREVVWLKKKKKKRTDR